MRASMSCLEGPPEVGAGTMGVIVDGMAASPAPGLAGSPGAPAGAWLVGRGEAIMGGLAPAGGWPSWMGVVAGMP